MIAIDRYGWMSVAVYVLMIWAILVIALLASWHRRQSGRWRPYSHQEVEDPDWDRKH